LDVCEIYMSEKFWRLRSILICIRKSEITRVFASVLVLESSVHNSEDLVICMRFRVTSLLHCTFVPLYHQMKSNETRAVLSKPSPVEREAIGLKCIAFREEKV